MENVDNIKLAEFNIKLLEENKRLKKSLADIEKHIESKERHYNGTLLKEIQLIKNVNGVGNNVK